MNMISFWRVIFTYVIMILHILNQYEYRTGWYIGVEFFFIVSGWLLAKDLATKRRNPLEYFISRYKRLYPEYFVAFVIGTIGIGHYLQEQISIVEWAKTIGIYELFMIQSWGFIFTGIFANEATWYISIMLLAGVIIYALGKYLPKATKFVILPALIIAFFTYSFIKYADLSDYVVDSFILNTRLYRGLAEMGIGYLLFHFNENKLNLFVGAGSKFLGALSMVAVIVGAFFFSGKADYIYVWLIALGVLISFNSELTKGKKVIRYLDEISYSLYLNHLFFRNYIFPKWFPVLSVYEVLIYLIVVTITASLLHLAVSKIVKLSYELRGKECR